MVLVFSQQLLFQLGMRIYIIAALKDYFYVNTVTQCSVRIEEYNAGQHSVKIDLYCVV